MSEGLRTQWLRLSPKERAEMVRVYGKDSRAGSIVGDIFGLTDLGVKKILEGDDWRPEYSMWNAETNEPTGNR